ncbi:MAG: potassium-transporting ATPase subunit KdpA [Caldilineaceae bacterium]
MDWPLWRDHSGAGNWRQHGRQTGGAPSPGTFPTDGVLFVVLLSAVILILGALTFFPALTLGPLVEQLLAQAGPEPYPLWEVNHDTGNHEPPNRSLPALLCGGHSSMPCAKLDPRQQLKNPVMLVVAVGALLTTAILCRDLLAHQADWTFTLQIALWLWFTVLFANFAEAMAEGRGKAQAESLRRTRTQMMARRLVGEREERVAATDLKRGDLVVCTTGDQIPSDGEVIEGIASVDESAITR